MRLTPSNPEQIELKPGRWTAVIVNGEVVAIVRNPYHACAFADDVICAGKLLGVEVPE